MKVQEYVLLDDVRQALRKMFYWIPKVDVRHGSNEIVIEFELDAYDVKHFTPSIVKRELQKYGKVTQSRFKHERLTGGRTVFTYRVEE